MHRQQVHGQSSEVSGENQKCEMTSSPTRTGRWPRQHGVRELWSADRDFGRFPGFDVVNPLVRKME
jgi:hypothetical protein